MSVLFALVLREMKGRFGAQRYGAFWLFFQPIVQIGLMTTIFALKAHHVMSGIDFPVFLLAGMVPFFWMRSMTMKGMEAVSANKALFAYKQIKPFDAILARAIVETALYICVYVILLFVLGFWFQMDISHHLPLRWISIGLICFVFSFSLGILFCIIGEAIPESKTVIKIFYLPLYLLSAVIFPIWLVPHDLLVWLLWNPYLHLVQELRMSVLLNYPEVPGISIEYPLIVTGVLFFVSMWLYRVRRLKLIAL